MILAEAANSPHDLYVGALIGAAVFILAVAIGSLKR